MEPVHGNQRVCHRGEQQLALQGRHAIGTQEPALYQLELVDDGGQGCDDIRARFRRDPGDSTRVGRLVPLLALHGGGDTGA